MTNGTYEPVEEEMMSSYIVFKLPAQHTFVHLRLGQPQGYSKENPAPRETRQLLLPSLPEADLVTRTLDGATIYEFTIWRPQTKLGQLRYYRTQLPATPGFEDLTEDKVNLVLVTAQMDSNVAEMARKDGITYSYFTTPSLEKKIAERRGGS